MTNLIIKNFVKNYENYEDPEVRGAYGKLAGWVGIIMNLLLFALKFFAGLLTKSISITADAINNLSDSASSIISLFGFKLAEKPADERHPYGHGRYEYISALTVTAIILVIGFELLKSGVEKLINPTPLEFNIVSVVILFFSVTAKLWLSLFNVKIGRKINSKVLLATAEDSRNDCISTVAVIISLLVSYLFKINIDGIVGIFVAIFIIYSAITLICDTLGTLLGTPPELEYVENIHNKIMAFDGVLGTHDMIVHDYGPGRCFASVHVEVAAEEDVLKSHDMIDNIERYFLKEENLNVIIHMDPIITKDEKVGELRKLISNHLKGINETLGIHDLRVVPGPTHTNIIFDCVIPHSLDISEDYIKEEVENLLNKNFENHFAVITFEKNFTPIPKN